MKRSWSTLLADLKAGKGPALLLLFGDDLQVEQACKSIIDAVVPPDQRGFNLERFDGRAAEWERIEASLLTPPFLSGKKLVWIENTTYFISRDQRAELSEKVFELWGDGKKAEAGKLLMDLLAVEGFTAEQWDQAQSALSGPLTELLDIEDSHARDDAEGLFAYCKSAGMAPAPQRGSGANGLLALLERGLPEWDFLLLTAVQVDRRTRLFKRLEELDAVAYLALERDRAGKVDREALLGFINQHLRESAKTLEPQAREMILNRCGGELRGLQQELDKLVLFIGERSTVAPRDIEAIFADRAEGWIFDLTRAMAERDAPIALSQLTRLMAQGEHPLKLLGTIAAEIRRLLAARQLLDTELSGAWRRGMSYQQFQQQVLRQGAPLLTRNSYADYMCFQRAEHFSLMDLRRHMEAVHGADLRLKSTGNQPRLIMERLILGMCLGSGDKQRAGLGARS